MYSSAGLADWEMLTVSGLFAASAMLIGSVIGIVVALVATREPHPVAATLPAADNPKADVTRTGVTEAKRPWLAVG